MPGAVAVTTVVVKSPADEEIAITLMRNRKKPYTVDIVTGKHRSVEQNQLQRKWLLEIADQLADMTAEEYRAYCKLHFGVPILRNESETFREAYDRVIRPHSYEDKLTMMALPLDFPVTRLMTTKQKTAYLDAIYTEFTGRGVQLTRPEGDRW